MSDEYTPTIEDRREGAKALEAALHQCGITVQWAIAGPGELFDVMNVLMRSKWFSEWLAEHDRAVLIRYEERRKPNPVHIDNIDGQSAKDWLTEHDREVAEAAWDEGHSIPQHKTNLNGDYLGKYKNPHTPHD